MLICGIKLTHDGGVAVIDGDRLLFSIETEKIANGLRYSPLGQLSVVTDVLRSEGCDPADIDQFVVDGWFDDDAFGGEAVPSGKPSRLSVGSGKDRKTLMVAPYQDKGGDADPVARFTFDDHDFGVPGGGYVSYHHVSNHLMGAYCASPFAAREEDAFVLVWDGGMMPRLYAVIAGTRQVVPVATLLPIAGNGFADFSSQFGPFHAPSLDLGNDEFLRRHLAIAGKAMAYAALGTVNEDTFSVFDSLLADVRDGRPQSAVMVGETVARRRDEWFAGMSDADLITSFQDYLGLRLLESLTSAVHGELPGQSPVPSQLSRSSRLNLVLAGGCALNIKWNSRIRASGVFNEIFIPPFPNDSGAAIGTAACEMFRRGGSGLKWDVYSGPRADVGQLPAGWNSRECDERGVAQLLHADGATVAVVDGRAELGPRALGNRSILAAATSLSMKDRLNDMKDRASYRPVAPVCLSSHAADVFTPGGHDPYMLFEHRTRDQWSERIPAVLHLDETARLQTIDESANSATARILAEYDKISGIPVLCNTSANFNGHGFFPDVASAARWGQADYVWSNGRVYFGQDDR